MTATKPVLLPGFRPPIRCKFCGSADLVILGIARSWANGNDICAKCLVSYTWPASQWMCGYATDTTNGEWLMLHERWQQDDTDSPWPAFDRLHIEDRMMNATALKALTAGNLREFRARCIDLRNASESRLRRYSPRPGGDAA